MSLLLRSCRARRARKRALKEALERSVLITSIEVQPPVVTAAQLRARAEETEKAERWSWTGFVLTCVALAALFVVFVVACTPTG